MSRLTVMLLTYNRMEYAEKTLRSALENIVFDGELAVHIADDGSPQGYRSELVSIAHSYHNVVEVTSSDSERRGYGANYNLGTQIAHIKSNYVLPLEDDWLLIRELDANLLAKVLDEGRVGCIRLGNIGYTATLIGEFIYSNNQHFILFAADSSELHIFAGGPRIETVTWERYVGAWPEGRNAGATEMIVAGSPRARRGIAWPVDMIRPSGDMFVHIGAESVSLAPLMQHE